MKLICIYINIYFRTLGITQAAIEFANSIPKKMKNEHKPQVRSVNKLSTYV